ncbi:MAG: DNA gyrase C-terminal beta-propeller domain-containing protein, partial [Cyanobacteria bacterium P01_H01_bin.130]
LTQGGYIKKTALSAFANIRANGLIAISLNDGDELRWVRLAQETDSILIGSRSGMAIHFRADRTQLRPLGRTARGVKSMNLKAGDELVGIDILPAAIADAVASSGEDDGDDDELLTDVSEDTEGGDDAEDGAELSAGEGTDDEGAEDTGEEDGEPRILVVTSQGYGKRIPVEQFKLYNRATKGKIATKFKSGQAEDSLAGILVVHDSDEIMLVTSRGIIIRQAVDAIPVQSRGATGVRLQRLDKSDAIAAVAVVPPEEKEVLDELEVDGEGDGTEEE